MASGATIPRVDSCRCPPLDNTFRTNDQSVVHSPNSRDRLNITRQCMTRLLAYHQIPASFLEFVFSYCREEKAQAFLFGAFRHQIRQLDDGQGLKITELNRSGNTIQICFNIRAPAITGQTKAWQWSIQQTAIYHSFDIDSGQSVWMLLKGDEDLAAQTAAALQSPTFPELRRFKSRDESFATALMTLQLFGQWASGNWREFVNDLEIKVREVTDRIISTRMQLYGPVPQPRTFTGSPIRRSSTFTSSLSKFWSLSRAQTSQQTPSLQSIPDNSMSKLPTPNIPPALESPPLSHEKKQFEFDDVQHVEVLEERVNDAILVLKTLKNVLEQMRRFYASFLQAVDTPKSLRKNCLKQFRTFELAIRGMEDELDLEQARLHALLNRLANRKQMVRYTLLAQQIRH